MSAELTPYEQFQLEKYGSILEKTLGVAYEELENGSVDRDDNDRRMDDSADLGLTEQEFY